MRLGQVWTRVLAADIRMERPSGFGLQHLGEGVALPAGGQIDSNGLHVRRTKILRLLQFASGNSSGQPPA